jgi:transcriptional regulator with XRE-family HTH domain
MIGENLREARLAQQRSLADVAKRAKISIATLSRIENEKQTLELGLFLTLAKLLDCSPTELLGEEDGKSGKGAALDPLVKKIAAFEPGERTRLWRELAAARRAVRPKAPRRLELRQLSQHVEELLAQVEFLRQELEIVHRRLRRRPSSR